MQQPRRVTLPVAEIEASAATQVRTRIDPNTVNDYAEAIMAGEDMPPLVVFAEKGSERYLLADGFHRLRGLKVSEIEEVDCDVYEGGVHEALEYALSANDTHGLRRNAKDKRNAVMLALKDPEWTDWNNVRISKLCRVSESLVRDVRESLVERGEIDAPETVKTIRDGKIVERKANRAHSFQTNEADSSKKSTTKNLTDEQKLVAKQVREDEKQKRLDASNRKTLAEGLSAIRAIPCSGTVAANKWTDIEDVQVAFVRDWCNEFLAARQRVVKAA